MHRLQRMASKPASRVRSCPAGESFPGSREQMTTCLRGLDDLRYGRDSTGRNTGRPGYAGWRSLGPDIGAEIGLQASPLSRRVKLLIAETYFRRNVPAVRSVGRHGRHRRADEANSLRHNNYPCVAKTPLEAGLVSV
jgi:hypothetical protein